MESNTVYTTKLTPSEGKYITQKYVAKEEDRIFSKELYIGINSKIEDWIEVDISKKDEYDKMMKEKYPDEDITEETVTTDSETEEPINN